MFVHGTIDTFCLAFLEFLELSNRLFMLYKERYNLKIERKWIPWSFEVRQTDTKFDI